MSQELFNRLPELLKEFDARLKTVEVDAEEMSMGIAHAHTKMLDRLDKLESVVIHGVQPAGEGAATRVPAAAPEADRAQPQPEVETEQAK